MTVTGGGDGSASMLNDMSCDVLYGINLNTLLRTKVFNLSTEYINSKSNVLFTPDTYLNNFSAVYFFRCMKMY